MRVAVVQSRHEAASDANLAAARRHVADAAARGAEVVLLPEYWFLPHAGDGPPTTETVRQAAAREPEVLELLASLSAEHGVAVAANSLRATGSGLRNVLRVADGGRVAWSQPKVHPMPGEAAWGVVGGPKLEVHTLRGVPAGGLVCADVLYPEAARVLAIRGAEIVLNPVLSRFRTPDPTKAAREAVYVARAWDGACFVLKASGFLPGKIAGRSLVAAPWGLVARYRDEAAEEVIVADLDLDALRAFRKEQRGFEDRRPDAYRGLVDGTTTPAGRNLPPPGPPA